MIGTTCHRSLWIDEIVSQEPTPKFVAILNETFQSQLQGLGDEAQLRQVTLLEFGGNTVSESWPTATSKSGRP